MLFHDIGGIEPEIGLIGHKCWWNQAPHCCELPIDQTCPYHCAHHEAIIKGLSLSLVQAQSPDKLFSSERAYFLNLRHFGVSPTAISGITPKIVTGSGSSTWKQIWPGTSHSGSMIMRSSPVISGVLWPSVVTRLSSLIGTTVENVRPVLSPRLSLTLAVS